MKTDQKGQGKEKGDRQGKRGPARKKGIAPRSLAKEDDNDVN